MQGPFWFITLHQGSSVDNQLVEGWVKPLLRLQVLVAGTQWVQWVLSHCLLSASMAEGIPDSPHSGRQAPACGLLKVLHQDK